jgi:purine-binding chemotaxis protein CheW
VESLLAFTLEGHEYALPVDAVAGVYRAAAVNPLPDQPPALLGVLNLHGEIVPVVSARVRLGLPARALSPHDSMIAVTAAGQRLVLVVDELGGVLAVSPAALQPAPPPCRPGLAPVDSTHPRADGLTVILAPAQLLTADELALCRLATTRSPADALATPR